jgi:phage baseplate assembly protein W
MPIQITKIDPLDLEPRKAVGISLNFTKFGVFNSTFQTKDAIKINIINFLLTFTGERYFNPQFGSFLLRQVFENITSERLSLIIDTVKDQLSIYFPNVLVNKAEILGTPSDNTITFYLNYSIPETGITNQEININIEQ